MKGAEPPAIRGTLGFQAVAVSVVLLVLVHRPALVHRVLLVQPVVFIVLVTLDPDPGVVVGRRLRLAPGCLLLLQLRRRLLCGGEPQFRRREAPLPFRESDLEPFPSLLRRALYCADRAARHVRIRVDPCHTIAPGKPPRQLIFLRSSGHFFQRCRVVVGWLRFRRRRRSSWRRSRQRRRRLGTPQALLQPVQRLFRRLRKHASLQQGLRDEAEGSEKRTSAVTVSVYPLHLLSKKHCHAFLPAGIGPVDAMYAVQTSSFGECRSFKHHR